MNDKQSAYTLIELSIVLVIIGLMVSVSAHFLKTKNKLKNQKIDIAYFERLDDAIQGYIMAHNRLPCPDTDSKPDGLENRITNLDESCTATRGYIPYISLGLASQPISMSSKALLAYAVYNNVSNKPGFIDQDAEITVWKDRDTTTPNTDNHLDFCYALNNISDINDEDYLHVISTETSSVSNVAYVIVDPRQSVEDDNTDLFEGENSESGISIVAYESPNKPRTVDYDDYVYAKYLDILWVESGCTP